jgi:hypothetical protein
VKVVSIVTPGVGDRSYPVHDGRQGLAIGLPRDADGLLGGLSAYPHYYAHMAPIIRAGSPPNRLRPPLALASHVPAGRVRL